MLSIVYAAPWRSPELLVDTNLGILNFASIRTPLFGSVRTLQVVDFGLFVVGASRTRLQCLNCSTRKEIELAAPRSHSSAEQ